MAGQKEDMASVHWKELFYAGIYLRDAPPRAEMEDVDGGWGGISKD